MVLDLCGCNFANLLDKMRSTLCTATKDDIGIARWGRMTVYL